MRVVGIQGTGQANLTKVSWAKIWIKSFYSTRTCLDCCSTFSLKQKTKQKTNKKTNQKKRSVVLLNVLGCRLTY